MKFSLRAVSIEIEADGATVKASAHSITIEREKPPRGAERALEPAPPALGAKPRRRARRAKGTT